MASDIVGGVGGTASKLVVPVHAPATLDPVCSVICLQCPSMPPMSLQCHHTLPQHQKAHATSIRLPHPPHIPCNTRSHMPVPFSYHAPCPCNARRCMPPLFACHAPLHVPSNARSDVPPPFDCRASLCPPQHQKLCTTSILLPHSSLHLQLQKPHATSVHLLCPLPEVTPQCCSAAMPPTHPLQCQKYVCHCC